MQIFDFEQGTPEWLECRAGIVTASCASDLLAKGQGKTRKAYLYKLLSEVMTGEPCKTWAGNAHTDRGHEHEGTAISLYERRHKVTVDRLGFIRNHDDIGGAGYSPDGCVGSCGGVEAKSRLPHIQVELLDTRKIPRDAKLQMQFGLWVTGWEWIDYISYCPGLPLFVERVEPDPKQHEEIREELIKFYAEMNQKLAALAEAA